MGRIVGPWPRELDLPKDYAACGVTCGGPLEQASPASGRGTHGELGDGIQPGDLQTPIGPFKTDSSPARKSSSLGHASLDTLPRI
jgi:hypothetical protein